MLVMHCYNNKLSSTIVMHVGRLHLARGDEVVPRPPDADDVGVVQHQQGAPRCHLEITHVCIYIYIHICMRMLCMYIYVYVYIYIYMYIHKHMSACICIRIYVSVYTYNIIVIYND